MLVVAIIAGWVTYRVTTEPSTTQATRAALWAIALALTAMALFATKEYLSVFWLWAGIGIGWLLGTNAAKTMAFDADDAAQEAEDSER